MVAVQVMTLDPPLEAIAGDCIALQYEPGGAPIVRRVEGDAALQWNADMIGKVTGGWTCGGPAAEPTAVGSILDFAKQGCAPSPAGQPPYLFGALGVPPTMWITRHGSQMPAKDAYVHILFFGLHNDAGYFTSLSPNPDLGRHNPKTQSSPSRHTPSSPSPQATGKWGANDLKRLSGRIQTNGVSLVAVNGKLRSELKPGSRVWHSKAPVGVTRSVCSHTS
eukprot:SAG31_NODE_4416_length_3252_cov_5.682207_3_plen_221_part_00